MKEYEITFRAELDDRGVENLADELFEMGYDDIMFRPIELVRPVDRDVEVTSVDLTGFRDYAIPAFEKKTCRECGEPYINWGAHAERCTGRPAKATS